MMDANWLFQIPWGTVEEVQAIMQARIAADPEARQITDEEAEAFFTTAYCLAFLSPQAFAFASAKMGITGYAKNKAWRRHATIQMLRTWRDSVSQEMFRIMRGGSVWGNLGAANEASENLQMANLVAAYHKRHPVIWLCHVLRLTDRADQIPLLLEQLDDRARSMYPIYLDMGRLMIRRIVDGVSQQAAQSPQAANQLKAQLRQKAKGTKHVERAMREQQASLVRHERWRKAKEVSLDTYLSGVQQEIAAAEGRLNETTARLAQEEARLLAEQEAQLAEVAAEAAALEVAFAEAIKAQTTSWPLSGLRVALAGHWGEAERLLIESAGGQWVPESADRPDLVLHLGRAESDQPAVGLFYTSESGPAALEQLLHRRLLPQISRFRPI